MFVVAAFVVVVVVGVMLSVCCYAMVSLCVASLVSFVFFVMLSCAHVEYVLVWKQRSCGSCARERHLEGMLRHSGHDFVMDTIAHQRSSSNG